MAEQHTEKSTPSTSVRGPGSPLGPRAVRTAAPSLSQLDLEPGTLLFGQWRIRRERRRGGHGVVFEAEDVHLGETHAVKVLDPGLMAQGDMLGRFRREVSLMRGFSHPHILKVFDYREDPDRHLALIGMEYVEGGTVRDLLDLARHRQARIPLVLSLRILYQALDALAEAHAQGVIHRDISPGNILLAGGSSQDLLRDSLRDPRVKLLDFGIARLVDKIQLSQQGEGLGTASYAAPEVFHPEEEITPATDVYSLGAVVWELITGHLPTVGSPRPSDVHEDAPPELDTFLLRLLGTGAAQRPDSEGAREEAEELLEQVSGVTMADWLSALGTRSTSTRVKSPTPPRNPPTTAPARHRAIRWGVGLAATLALALLWMSSPFAGTSGPQSAEMQPTAMQPTAMQPTAMQPTEIQPAAMNILEDDRAEAVPAASTLEEGSNLENPTIGPNSPSAVRPPGLYLRADAPIGTRLDPSLLEPVTTQGESEVEEDRPFDFETDLAGSCLAHAVAAGELLEWTDLKLCV